jgi:hypothetical protein
MRFLALGLILSICTPASGGGAIESEDTGAMIEKYRSALDGSGDVVLSRAFVPSAEKRHGEVRLVRRDRGLVVQTLLYSKLLKRVVARIEEKERRSWPPERQGHRDALGYIEALESAQREIAAGSPDGTGDRDRRQKMLIEFIREPAAAVVAVYELRMTEAGDQVRITGKRPLAIIEPSRHYVEENMKLIAADSLKLTDDETRELSEQLAGPLARETR